jgi:hypothetical protein
MTKRISSLPKDCITVTEGLVQYYANDSHRKMSNGDIRYAKLQKQMIPEDRLKWLGC